MGEWECEPGVVHQSEEPSWLYISDIFYVQLLLHVRQHLESLVHPE